MRRLNVVSLFDILPGLKAGDSYGTFRRKPEVLRWVPASSSGLTAPALHGQEAIVLAPKC